MCIFLERWFRDFKIPTGFYDPIILGVAKLENNVHPGRYICFQQFFGVNKA
jgi:hypothetical protein